MNSAKRQVGMDERRGYWREVMAEAVASGLSQRAFCQRHGITEAVFYYWRRILAEAEHAPSSAHASRLASGNAVRFALVRPSAVPVEVAASVAADGVQTDGSREAKLELVLDCGWRLRIGSGADVATIHTVLAALRASVPAAGSADSATTPAASGHAGRDLIQSRPRR
jgi:transposase-like protein